MDAIAIEVHDDTSYGTASELILATLRGGQFDIEQYGNLIFGHR